MNLKLFDLATATTRKLRKYVKKKRNLAWKTRV
jgi:hypothetical protein